MPNNAFATDFKTGAESLTVVQSAALTVAMG